MTCSPIPQKSSSPPRPSGRLCAVWDDPGRRAIVQQASHPARLHPMGAGFRGESPALQLPELSLYILQPSTDPICMILRLISAFALAAAIALPAVAQDRRVPASTSELRLSYAPVVQKAAP